MTATTQEPYQYFVGIDVAATSLSVSERAAQPPAQPAYLLPQSERGYRQLLARLDQTGVARAAILVVLEATGSYWMNLANYLHQQGVAVSVINPKQAHHFAKALLKQAKTDALDACLLAELAACLQPAAWSPPPAVYQEVQQRLAQRDSLLNLRQQVRNQLHALTQQPVIIAAVEARMQQLIATFDAQIAAVEAELLPALAQDDAWAHAAARLRSISGIGLVTAAWLLTTTLAFTTCPTPEAATAYAGLAPRPRESGSRVRGRASIGHTGQARLRTALYLATLSAAQHNPLIRDFYQRLRAAGKPVKVARCAAARKLLHIAWAVVTKQEDFDPSYGRSPAPAECAA